MEDSRGASPFSDSAASEVPEPEADLPVRGYATDIRAEPFVDRAEWELRMHLNLRLGWTARSDGLGHGDEEGGRRPPAPRCAAVGSAPILIIACWDCVGWDCVGWDAVGWITALVTAVVAAVVGARASG